MVIATMGKPIVSKAIHKKSYDKSTNKQLLDIGEPFLISTDPELHKIPLIRLLGPGSFWRLSTSEFPIVGEALDYWEDMRQFYDLMNRRRFGDIWGRWFSKHCREGELGFQSIFKVEKISAQAYEEAVSRIQRGVA